MEHQVESYVGGCVATNAYLVKSASGQILIDAPADVAGWLKSLDARPDLLLLTHQHFDHVEGVAAVVESFGCPVMAFAHPSEELIRAKIARANWGLPIEVPDYEVSSLVSGGQVLDLAFGRIRVEHVPGHSPDSVVFISEEGGWVASGDTLMAGSVGRTDLPGGSSEQLFTGIRESIYALADECLVMPGHGPLTQVGREKAENPFV